MLRDGRESPDASTGEADAIKPRVACHQNRARELLDPESIEDAPNQILPSERCSFLLDRLIMQWHPT